MSTNSLEFADWLAMESLRILKNEYVIGQFFNTDYNSEYTKEFTVGETVRVPFPVQYIASNQMRYDPQPIIDRHATVSIDRVLQVGIEWDSVEAALKMPRSEERISNKVLKPAMAEMRQQLESQCAQWAYLNTPNVVGTLGTNPTTFDSVFGAAEERFIELGAPTAGDRGMILSPGLARSLRAGAVSYFQPADQIRSMFRTSSIGMANNFDSYTSASLYSHTAGTWAGAVTVTTTSVSGATTLAVTCTTGDTFNAGDSFTVGSVFEVNRLTRRTTGKLKHFQVATSTVGAASAATLSLVYASSAGAIIGPGSPYQNVDALPVAAAALTLMPGTTSPNGKSGFQSLAIHGDAFALVGVKLGNPKASSAEVVGTARDPKTGLSISFLRMFDPIERKWINRFDCLFGFGNFYNDVCSVRIEGA